MTNTLFSHLAKILNWPIVHPKLAFWLLSSFIGILLVSHTINQRWQGDFWQHSACIHELCAHPFSPRHPHLAEDSPHEFYSPYALALGCGGRIVGASSITVLSLVGVFNLSLFVSALWLFVRLVSKSATAPFYTLLFTMVLWGPPPLMFSGFFHLQVLGDVAQYPSFFSAALTLLAWAILLLITRGGSSFLFFPLAALLDTVLLTHPPTAVSLNIGLAAIWLGAQPTRWRVTLALVAVFLSQVAVALLWPYYPFIETTLHAPATHHSADKWCYADLLIRYWPLWFCLPALMARARHKWTDPVVISFLGCLGVFGFGYLTGKYAFGRSIAYVMLFAHVAAADWLATTQTKLSEAKPRPPRSKVVYLYSVAVMTLILGAYYGAVAVYRYRPGRPSTYKQFVFLRQPEYQERVILADLSTAVFVGSFGGKVAALETYQRFVPDHLQRQREVAAFFNSGIANAARREIIRKYHVEFILVNQSVRPVARDVMDALFRMGNVSYHKDMITMITVQAAGVQTLRIASSD